MSNGSGSPSMDEAHARGDIPTVSAVEPWSPASRTGAADPADEMSNDHGEESVLTSAALLPVEALADRRAVLASAVNALVSAGFGINSTPAEDVISMQRAWQGPEEHLVMVDVVTLDTHGQGLAVREGVTGLPVWGPERGEWSAMVAAVVSQTAPQGYVQVAPRQQSIPEGRGVSER